MVPQAGIAQKPLDRVHRAFPPLGARNTLDENIRAISAFGLVPRLGD